MGSTQETPCDFRLIAATNRNLEYMVEEESFRRDLFYRLQTVHIPLPPLRERQEDILPLAHHFCAHFSELYALPAKQLATGTATALQLYGWPGNVRELCGAMERSVLTAGRASVIFPQHLPTGIRIHATTQRLAALSVPKEEKGSSVSESGLPSYAEFREQVWQKEEGRYLARILDQTGGNISEACEVTGLSRSRLYALLKRHGLTR